MLFTGTSTGECFKNPYKKTAKQKNRVYGSIAFCKMEKRGWKTSQKLHYEKTRIYAQKPRLKMAYENSISAVLFAHPAYSFSHFFRKN
jgi:hypothetical protein